MSNRLTVARHHLDTGNPQRALEVISALDAEELQGAQSEAYEIAANAKLEMSDAAGARDFARKALAIDPDNLEAMRTLAWSAAALGDRETVASTMNRALVAAPSNVTLQVDCAGLLINEGRLPEAKEFLERAVAMEPDSVMVKISLMEYTHASGDHRRTRSLAREILAQEPDHVRALAIDAVEAERKGDIRSVARRMRRLATLRLGDKDIAQGAREATAWSHPVVRPAWWLFQRWWGRWLGITAGVAVFRMTITWSSEKELPLPPVYVGLVVTVAYLGACLAWVDEKKTGPARKWVPRDE